MTKKKTEESPKLLREPKAKKKLGLSVPKLVMPHDELFQPRIISFNNVNSLDSQVDLPLDSQNKPEIAKTDKISYPNQTSLDSQNKNRQLSNDTNPGYPNENVLDIPIQPNSYPSDENLDSLIADQPLRISKNKQSLDSSIAKSKNLDSQKKQKSSEIGRWAKYDKNRANRKGIFLRTNDEITKQFKQFCIRHELEFAQGTELAWTKFMDSLDSQSHHNLDSLIAHNNKQLKMMWKTKPLIINLYYAYNQFFTKKVKWTVKDDLTGQKFNDIDIRVIELGILQTQANLYAEGNQDTSINGFLYYANEINRFVIYEENPEMLDAILKINRANWEKITGKSVDLSFLESQE